MFSLFVLAVGLGAWWLQVMLTKKDHFFDDVEMIKHHGVGLPMKHHYTIMYSDPFVLTPLLALIGWTDNRNWSWRWDGLIALLAFALSAGMHFQYLTDKIENAWKHDGRLTEAAIVHFFFMWMAFYLLGHSYLRVPHENPTLLFVTSLALLTHVVVGTHIVVKLNQPNWFTPNQPLADTPTVVVWVGSAVLLAGLTWFNLHFVG